MKLVVDNGPRVIAAKDRQEARMTAPASGLYLVDVDYGDDSVNKTLTDQ